VVPSPPPPLPGGLYILSKLSKIANLIKIIIIKKEINGLYPGISDELPNYQYNNCAILSTIEMGRVVRRGAYIMPKWYQTNQ